MSLFLPFSNPSAHSQKTCSLCDLPALYVAIIRIRISDPSQTKLVATELDFAVCQIHADKMDVEFDKTLTAEKELKIFLP